MNANSKSFAITRAVLLGIVTTFTLICCLDMFADGLAMSWRAEPWDHGKKTHFYQSVIGMGVLVEIAGACTLFATFRAFIETNGSMIIFSLGLWAALCMFISIILVVLSLIGLQ